MRCSSTMNPEAEHSLDWFHITMRVTVMGQYAKGLDTTQENRQEILKSLESVKHYLWHGNVARARDRIEDIHCFLDNEELTGENSRKLRKALDEFDTYVVINEALIPNYGERWRNGEAIATGSPRVPRDFGSQATAMRLAARPKSRKPGGA